MVNDAVFSLLGTKRHAQKSWTSCILQVLLLRDVWVRVRYRRIVSSDLILPHEC